MYFTIIIPPPKLLGGSKLGGLRFLVSVVNIDCIDCLYGNICGDVTSHEVHGVTEDDIQHYAKVCKDYKEGPHIRTSSIGY